MARDDFPTLMKALVADRAGMRCSSPGCRAAKVGPQEGGTGSVNLGVACHITAVAPGSPRYDASIGTEARRSDTNGLWLCQTCAKRVDSDASYYSVALLLEWKAEAERQALAELGVRGIASFYPPRLLANHTPIPRIGVLTRLCQDSALFWPLLPATHCLHWVSSPR